MHPWLVDRKDRHELEKPVPGVAEKKTTSTPFSISAANAKNAGIAKKDLANSFAKLVAHGPFSLSLSENRAIVEFCQERLGVKPSEIPQKTMVTECTDNLTISEDTAARATGWQPECPRGRHGPHRCATG